MPNRVLLRRQILTKFFYCKLRLYYLRCPAINYRSQALIPWHESFVASFSLPHPLQQYNVCIVAYCFRYSCRTQANGSITCISASVSISGPDSEISSPRHYRGGLSGNEANKDAFAAVFYYGRPFSVLVHHKCLN